MLVFFRRVKRALSTVAQKSKEICKQGHLRCENPWYNPFSSMISVLGTFTLLH